MTSNEQPRILRNVQSQAIADAGQDAINAILTLVDLAEKAEKAIARVREVCESSAFYCTTREWGDLEAVATDDVLVALDGDSAECRMCNGTGDVQVHFQHGIQTQDCAECGGTGDTRE